MKIRLLLLVLISFCYLSKAQDLANEQKELEEKIRRNWVKYRVEMKDGSKVADEDILKKAASMIIFKNGNACVLISGKTAYQSQYVVSSKALILDGKVSYVIEKLTEYELIFHGVFENIPDEEIVRYHYVSTKESSSQYYFRQFIKPNIRIKANGDTAYNFNEYIFPKFKLTLNDYPIILSNFYEVYESSYDMIEKEFNFPDRKQGNFTVTFGISKSGVLQDIKIIESSDSTYNNALLQAVYKTRKRWLPAEYENKSVETLFTYAYIYGGEKEERIFDNYEYDITKYKANRQFEKKEYIKAIKLYTKCILMQEKDFDLEPYYKRADSYFALKVNKNACLDWSYLSKSGQKKAEKLFFDNCMK